MRDYKCKVCITPCKECSGGSDSDCITCETPRLLYNKICVETCPPGFWGDNSDPICKMCQSPCKNCHSSSNTCTSCIENYFLNLELCLRECPSGFWGISK